MIEKNKILESWIMVEHLSEGDIGLNDKAILTLNDLQEQDFYSLFLHKIEKKKWNRRQKGGVVVYFDIFKFQEVVDILHAEYTFVIVIVIHVWKCIFQKKQILWHIIFFNQI